MGKYLIKVKKSIKMINYHIYQTNFILIDKLISLYFIDVDDNPLIFLYLLLDIIYYYIYKKFLSL